jgi:hypothetical protein
LDSTASRYVSELSAIEAVSALAKKVRKGQIGEADFRIALYGLLKFLYEGCEVVPLTDADKEWESGKLSGWGLTHRLTTLDALILATAVRSLQNPREAEFWCAGPSLNSAAEWEGFLVVNPELT